MSGIIHLSEIILEKHILLRSESKTSEELISKMMTLLSDEFTDEVREQILESIFLREKQKSTGIGYGVAVPHVRSTAVKQLRCLAATLEDGIDFKALDGKPVYLFFLIVSPDSTIGPHLNIISAISRLLGNNKNISSLFTKANTPEQFLSILRKEEEKFLD